MPVAVTAAPSKVLSAAGKLSAAPVAIGAVPVAVAPAGFPADEIAFIGVTALDGDSSTSA